MVIFTLSVCIILLALIAFYQKKGNAVCYSKKSLNGKTALITGGNRGIGLEVALDLAKRGARTIIACRFDEDGTLAKKQIINNTGNPNVVFKRLDLGSLASVRKFASEIIDEEDRLDIFVNNAGVGIARNEETNDGIGYIMQVNYFGAFLLTLLLLPILTKSGTQADPSRIINTSSALHLIGTVDFNKMKGTRKLLSRLYLIQIYGNSKLCVTLFTNELSRRLRDSNVVVHTVDPGFVATRIYMSYDIYIGYLFVYLISVFMKTVWEGAQTTLHVVLDEEAGRKSGMFYNNCKESKARGVAYDEKLAKKLWQESVRLTKISDTELQRSFHALKRKSVE